MARHSSPTPSNDQRSGCGSVYPGQNSIPDVELGNLAEDLDLGVVVVVLPLCLESSAHRLPSYLRSHSNPHADSSPEVFASHGSGQHELSSSCLQYGTVCLWAQAARLTESHDFRLPPLNTGRSGRLLDPPKYDLADSPRSAPFVPGS